MNYNTIKDSPVETVRKNDLPKGDAQWPGWSSCYDVLNRIANECFNGPYAKCSSDHVFCMAILGCGHEETMKNAIWLYRSRFNLNY